MGEKVDDLGEGMQCTDHPFRNNPGGICAFCLQDKLGKLVSSSKSTFFFPVPPPSSSSSPPSRSECTGAAGGVRAGRAAASSGSISAPKIGMPHLPSRAHIHFFAHKKKKVVSSDAGSAAPTLKRSRSVAVPSRHFCVEDSPRVRRGFWSFLHLSRRRALKAAQQQAYGSPAGRREDADELPGGINESPNNSSHASSSTSSFGRKVGRSRSVGCGSRSFSGDFLERISTGLGDCALRRVESQREAKPNIDLGRVTAADGRMKEKIKCGGIFGIMGGSYSVTGDLNGRISQGAAAAAIPHGKGRGWGWAFASPMRAFRPSATKSIAASANSDGLSSAAGSNNIRHHLNKIESSPSLLTVKT